MTGKLVPPFPTTPTRPIAAARKAVFPPGHANLPRCGADRASGSPISRLAAGPCNSSMLYCAAMGASSSSAVEKDGPAVVKLDAATARALEKVAKASGKTTTQLTRAALREFLDDYWDMLEVERRAKRGAKTLPWPEVKKRLGLDG